MQRAFIVPANAIVDVQLGGNLPGVLREESKRIHKNLAVRIAKGNRLELTTLPARKSANASIARVSRVPAIGGPGEGPLGAIKVEAAQRMAMIKLIELRLAEFAAKFELVLADGPREIIRKVAGDVVAALGRRLANRVKPAI